MSDTEVQLVWRALPPGSHRASVDDRSTTFEVAPGAVTGAFTVRGLPADRRHDVRLDGVTLGTVDTLAALRGPVIARVATISDVHIGETEFGHWPTLREPPHRGAHPLRCLRAAVSEIAAWDPDLVVVKGDLAHRCHRREYEAAAEVLTQLGCPVVVLRGNHDGGNERRDDGAPILSSYGLQPVAEHLAIDVPGLRVVAVDTVRHRFSHGKVAHRLEAIAGALDAPLPCLLLLHHPPDPLPLPTHWPVGLTGSEPGRLIDVVAEANPATMLSAGHTHRNRRRVRRGITITEVGSVKDHPGVWAGYEVHEDGVRQVVRRITEPSAIDWTERTAAMLWGQWGRWAPGRLDDRCFNLPWPADRVPAPLTRATAGAGRALRGRWSSRPPERGGGRRRTRSTRGWRRW